MLEISQQIFSMRRAVTGTWVPSFGRLIDIIMPLGDGPERWQTLVSQVINQIVQMPAARIDRLIATRNKRRPKGRNCAGPGSNA